jgi:hypothetical protein
MATMLTWRATAAGAAELKALATLLTRHKAGRRRVSQAAAVDWAVARLLAALGVGEALPALAAESAPRGCAIAVRAPAERIAAVKRLAGALGVSQGRAIGLAAIAPVLDAELFAEYTQARKQHRSLPEQPDRLEGHRDDFVAYWTEVDGPWSAPPPGCKL